MKKKKKKEKDTEYHMADDGTMVEKSDWEWLQEHKKKNKKKKINGYYVPGDGTIHTLYEDDK
tara:strand:- start:597 stop:782 length:186 start_codon:yes stop_codon:yes gene_type:complete